MVPPRAIVVPTQVSAYINYDEAHRVIERSTDPNAYLSPFTSPNFESLHLGNNLVKHDIFEHLRNRPYRTNQDRYRLQPRRTGIYLSWTLPKMFRTGLTGTASAAKSLRHEIQYGGYPLTSNAVGQTVYRNVPNRWLITRIVRPKAESGKVYKVDNSVKGFSMTAIDWRYDVYGGPAGSLGPRTDYFVVESDILRTIDQIPPNEDTAVSSTAYLDADSSLTAPNTRPGRVFLGRTSKLSEFSEGSGPRELYTLTVEGTANPYFADYSPQNGGVFSFFDDLTMGTGSDKIRLAESVVDYVVTGYHNNESLDPLFVLPGDQTPASRLDACSLTQNPQSLVAADTDWLSKSRVNNSQWHFMRTLCHGTFFNLEYNVMNFDGTARQSTMQYPGDNLQKAFATSHPLSVGTNPIDALFGWLRSTSSDTDQAAIKQSLLKLQSLVLDVNDDIDSQLQSEDLLATNNFLPTPAGKISKYVSGFTPTDAQIKSMRAFNALEARDNALRRETSRLKGRLFSLWFTYTADRNKGSKATLQTSISGQVSDVQNKLIANQAALDQSQKDMANTKPAGVTLQDGADQPFYVQRDPTLFVAGTSPQWPSDFDDNAIVRLDDQIGSGSGHPNIYSSTVTDPFSRKMPNDLTPFLKTLIDESATDRTSDQTPTVPSAYSQKGDRFQNKNGWFPLFIEYEVEYYHIPFENWQFGPQGPEGRVGYSISPGANLSRAEIQNDFRIIKGRCPVLPQAANALQVVLKQVFSKVSPEILDPILSADARTQLLGQVSQLDFCSAAMTGLTDNLLTQIRGAHISPVNYDSNGNGHVSASVQDIATEIGLQQSDLLKMDSEAKTTPFASLVPIPANPASYTPFKPCTHGQFRFIKLNIVDKFGQIVEGVRTVGDARLGTTMSTGPLRTILYPCLGEAYSVEALTDGNARTVIPSVGGLCPFVQLPPSINQPARVNGDFMIYDKIAQNWHCADQYIDPSATTLQGSYNPVRGWIVINSANVSLQFFTVNGDFVVEISIMSGQPSSRPFARDASKIIDPMLQGLIDKFSVPNYLTGFFASLARTIEAVQTNPTAYGESMLSVLGRPLALTVLGVSLELMDPPRTNQSTLAPAANATLIGNRNLLDYEFGLKLGDKDNIFDGLYGYFNINKSDARPDFESFFTYSAPDKPNLGDPSQPIPASTLKPFYADRQHDSLDLPTQQFTSTRLFACLVDPFTAIHAYTALLPIKQMILPEWSIAPALGRITSFFKAGPVLIPSDVPAFDPNVYLHADYSLVDTESVPPPSTSIPVPAVALGDWNWLQPYRRSTGATSSVTLYNALGVEPPTEGAGTGSGKGGLSSVPGGPYTAVEGYLQMKKPFEKPDPSGVGGNVGTLTV